MTPEAKARRRQKDHERYIANAEERKARQRHYYATNKEILRQRRRERGMMKVVIH